MKNAFKLIILIFILLFSITACGVKHPVVEESEMGIQLEDKARDAVEKQSQQADDADNKLDNVESH